MSIPQIPDRMKAAPTQALRAVFAGIGRIFLAAADRPGGPSTASEGRNGTEGDYRGQWLATGQQTDPSPPAAASRWRSLDKTGNVRLLSAEDLREEFGSESPRPGAPAATLAGEQDASAFNGVAPAGRDTTPAGGVAAASAGLFGNEHVDQADPAPGGSVPGERPLPIADYDQLSLASIRARLRSLSVGELRTLADYEASHAERTDVLGMFERRISKLEADG